MLLDVIARQLKYASWLPAEQTALLKDLIEEGIVFLARYDPSITEESLENDYFARSLLVEYVRYAISNARDDFKVNYRTEILSLSDRGRVYRAQQQAAENDDI